MISNRKLFVTWFLLFADLALFYASLLIAIKLRFDRALTPQELGLYLKSFTVIFLMWLVVFFVHGLFEAAAFRRYSVLIFKLISALLVSALLAVLYFYAQPNFSLTPRRFLLLEMITLFVLLLILHLSVKAAFKNRMVQGVYLFSFNNELQQLEHEISGHNYLGYKVYGHLNQQSLASADLNQNAAVILPDNLNANADILKQLYDLRTKGLAFYNFRDFYEYLLRRVYLSELNEAWFLENINYGEKRLYNLIKRAVDILFGIIGMIFFIVSWPFCAALIKLTSPGPVLFTQERVGKGGKIFRVYKYRSMYRTDYRELTGSADARITKIGKILRKTRIDEWPQFINLIAGHMSLVGPRPEQPHAVEEFKKQIPFYDERHLVKPGITGWSQLNSGYAANAEETKIKLQYDLYYIKNRSMLLDLEIILKTLYYIFTWQGR